MPLLSDKDATYLREVFAQQLVNPVTVTLFTQKSTLLTVPGHEQETEYCRQANEIVQEVAALTDKITVETYDVRTDAAQFAAYGIERIPAILLGAGDDRPARFFGVTAGYEFSTFVQDLLDISNGNIELTEATLEYVRGLTSDVHIQVFSTPT